MASITLPFAGTLVSGTSFTLSAGYATALSRYDTINLQITLTTSNTVTNMKVRFLLPDGVTYTPLYNMTLVSGETKKYELNLSAALSGITFPVSDDVQVLKVVFQATVGAVITLSAHNDIYAPITVYSSNFSQYAVTDIDNLFRKVNQLQEFSTPKKIMVEDAYIPNRLLVWEDDFDYPELDDTAWTAINDGSGLGDSNALQYYTSRQKNIRLEASNLVISAVKENYKGKYWTSGRITTLNKHSFKYGRLEMKARIPNNKGLCPSFWTMGEKTGGANWPYIGEIDIIEHLSDNDWAWCDVHAADASENVISQQGYYDEPAVGFDDAYHIYAVEWTDTDLKFYFDGTLVNTFTYAAHSFYNNENPFLSPHFIILCMSVGSTAGNPDATTPSKCEMYVDWVRVYAPVGVSTYVQPTGITLSPEYITNLAVNAEYQFTPTITPSNVSEPTTIWTSLDPEGVSVNGGLVKGLKLGEHYIKAETIDGHYATAMVLVQ